MTPPPAPQPFRFTLIHAIMAALLVWGGYLAVGAIRAPGSLGAWRGIIVFACTLMFLGMWAAALAMRRSSK